MTVGLLQEYVALMVEKIRTKKGQKGLMGDKFDLKRFKALPDERSMLAYASKFLDRLGSGSSRSAFLLSGKYALKIALNEKGLAQNNAELDVFTNPESKPIVAKVYGADEDNRWLISDLVKPLQNPDEFDSLTGTNWDDFVETVKDHLGKKGTKTAVPDEFTSTVISNAKANNMLVGDIEEIHHWGKTPDGRAVLLDYGFTESVYQDHYSDRGMPSAKSAPSDAGTVKPGDSGNTRHGGGFDKTGVDPHKRTSKVVDPNKTEPTQYAKTGMGPNVGKKQPAPDSVKTAAAKKPSSDDAKTAAPQKKLASAGGTKPVRYSPDDDEKTGR